MDNIEYKFESHDYGIYSCKDAYIKFLLLNKSIDGIIILPLTAKPRDDELKVFYDDIWSYDLSGIGFRSMNWVNKMKPEYQRSISIEQYVFIVEIIKNFFLGVVSQGLCNNKLYFHHNMYRKYHDDEFDGEYYEYWESERLKECKNTIRGIRSLQIVSNEQPQPIVERRKVNKLVVVEKKSERMYNLLYGDFGGETGEVSDAVRNRKRCLPDTRNMNLTGDEKEEFTREEVEAIAHMSRIAVMDSYNVSSYVASIYIINAKDILDINHKHDMINTFAEYFDQGLILDDVCKIYKGIASKSQIRSSYYSWDLARKYSGSDYRAYSKWKDPEKIMPRDELIEYVHSTPGYQFGYDNECTLPAASNILQRIRINYFSKNPYYPIFGKDALYEDYNSKIFSDNTKSGSCDQIISTVIDNLKEAYVKSFDLHSKILTKNANIPSEVPEDLKEQFIWLIKARFKSNIKSKMSNRDLEFIENSDPGDIAFKYLIRYNSIKYIKKKIKEDKEA